MKTLVTGAAGFIGSSVVRELVARGREVKAMSHGGDVRNLEGLDLEVVRADLLDPDSLGRAMQGCDRLFHVAALYRHWHPRGGDFIRWVNVEGTRNVLDLALRRGLEMTVHTSSISSVGFFPDRLSTELDFPALEDCRRQPYRESKFLSERIALEYAEKMPLVIVNPASPIGVRDYLPTPTGRMILDFLNGKMFAYVDVGINLIDVEDMAMGFVAAEEKGGRGRRYILGNANLFLREFLEMMADMTGLPAPRVKIPRAVIRAVAEVNQVIADLTKKEPLVAVEQALHLGYNEFADCRKAVQELGLPQKDIRLAIAKAVRYYLEAGMVDPARAAMIDLREPPA